MPIQNMATLLENIVLVEAARLLFEGIGQAPVDFVNSFAMPPLAEWRPHKTNSYFNHQRIAACIDNRDLDDYTGYTSLLRACCEADLARGPNGALLVGVLSSRLGRRVRYWLNDVDEGSRYSGSVAQLRGFCSLVKELVPGGKDPEALVVCEVAYDASLTNLLDVLTRRRNTHRPAGRLGFLDPDRYRVSGRASAETASADHRRWLAALVAGPPGLVLAVHFTGHRNYPLLQTELESLWGDARAERFQASLTARHGYYTTTVSILDPRGPSSAVRRLRELRRRISVAWDSWCSNTGGGRASLDFDGIARVAGERRSVP